jgi:hypothetical protein
MIQVATKEALRKRASNRKYIIGKGPIKVGDSFREIAEKEARKPKSKRTPTPFTIDLDDEDDEDYFVDFVDHPELMGFDFGITDMELGVPDPFKAQAELIKFN